MAQSPWKRDRPVPCRPALDSDWDGRVATASGSLPVPTAKCSGGPGGRAAVGSTDTPTPQPRRGVPTALSRAGHIRGENRL